MVQEYSDQGHSGRTDDGPGFQQMIADALSDKKPFGTIIVHNRSRFSRSASELRQHMQELEQAGVRLLSTTEPR